MFKSKHNNTHVQNTSDEILKSISQSKSSVPSIIAEGFVLNGNLHADGNLEISGRVNGDIEGDMVNIRETGFVFGNITCKYLKISGKFEGQINATYLHASKSSNIKGDVSYQLLTTEEHAVICGNLLYTPANNVTALNMTQQQPQLQNQNSKQQNEQKSQNNQQWQNAQNDANNQQNSSQSADQQQELAQQQKNIINLKEKIDSKNMEFLKNNLADQKEIIQRQQQQMKKKVENE